MELVNNCGGLEWINGMYKQTNKQINDCFCILNHQQQQNVFLIFFLG